jgi:hypothetical protein
MSKNGMKISLDCPFKGLSHGIDTATFVITVQEREIRIVEKTIKFLLYLNIIQAL